MAALPPAKALLDTEAACEGDCFASATSSQICPEPSISRPPRANWTCLPGSCHASMFPCYHLLSLCPALGWVEHGFLRGSGTLHSWIRRRALLRHLLQSFTHGIHSFAPHQGAAACSDTGSAHTTHVIFYMQTPLCSHSLKHWHPLLLAMPRGAFDFPLFFFHVQKGKGRADSQR